MTVVVRNKCLFGAWRPGQHAGDVFRYLNALSEHRGGTVALEKKLFKGAVGEQEWRRTAILEQQLSAS